MKCPICFCEDSFLTLNIKGYELTTCRRCGHAVTDPLPGPDELAALYNEAYFAAHYPELRPADRGFKRRIRQEDHRVKLVRRHKKRGRLLDVGCGRGYFLYACKPYFACTGFDITTRNQDFIERYLGLDFISPAAAPVSSPGLRFDVLTFWHSLEHFSDPENQLGLFTDLLAEDGILIIDVPNHEAVDAFMEGEDWPGWDLPFHCHHFTRRSLERLLARLGFEVLAANTYHCGYIRDRLLKNQVVRYFARPLAKLFPGSSVALVCRKRAA